MKPLVGKPPGTLLVHEIYRSVQGESTFVGRPCVFVRLSACHLRCRWCDTPHAFTEGEPMGLDDVLARVLAEPCDLVEITGGEPLLQDEVFPLMTRLADAGRTVLLETSGAVDIRRVDRRVRIIMDLKCPGSDECERNLYPNIERLKPTDEIKFVIADRCDFDWSCEQVRGRRLAERFTVLFSPVFGELAPRTLAEWILESNLPVRLQLQMHKYIWDPAARGV
ncbi:MAG: radical SAM protein [Planctomycetes bacterium]|nr:radical SAM protein [Planctomycetota bacterium]